MFSDHNRINYKSLRDTGQSPNNWKLNNTFLDSPWVKEEISKEKNYFELNKIKMQYQNLWDSTKILMKVKFITLTAYLKSDKDPKSTI